MLDKIEELNLRMLNISKMNCFVTNCADVDCCMFALELYDTTSV